MGKRVKEDVIAEEKAKEILDDKDTEVIEETATELSECEKMALELEQLRNYSLRMKADMDNMKKRNQNIASEMYKDGKIETLIAILPVADSIDRALSMDVEGNVKEGIEKIQKQFEGIFEKLGVEEIKSQGEEFDPNLHNALMQVDDADNSGKCVQVYEKGYKFGDKVLRHASVVVAK